MAEPYFPKDVDEHGNEYVLTSCPVKYVAPSIIGFLEVYDYHTQFPSAQMPAYDDVNPRFLQAAMYLEKWTRISMEELNNGR